MSEARHTPGPWKAEGYDVRQSGLNGTRMIAEVCYTGPHHTPPNEYPTSCRIIDEANARLISASPDLLEALKRLVELLDPADAPEAYVQAAQAIAKAKGE